MNSTRPMSLSMCGLFLAALSAASACGPLTGDELAQSTERLTGCRGAPYPIVLAHGMAGWEKVGPVNYFFNVARDLRAHVHAQLGLWLLAGAGWLLALTARTLRQGEFIALEKLAGVEATVLNKAMLSVDRFVREDDSLPVDPETRAALLDRFGMFGIRIAITLLRAGITDSVALADELLERSGLVALRDVIDQQFAQRSELLKAHTALLALRRLVSDNPFHATAAVIADIDPLLADTHAFEELRLLSQLRSRSTTLNDDEVASLRRIIGGSGTDAASRLGLTPDVPYDGPRAALAAVGRWRRRAEHPLNDPFTTRACRAAVRSAEALVADYRARGDVFQDRAQLGLAYRDVDGVWKLWDVACQPETEECP